MSWKSGDKALCIKNAEPEAGYCAPNGMIKREVIYLVHEIICYAGGSVGLVLKDKPAIFLKNRSEAGWDQQYFRKIVPKSERIENENVVENTYGIVRCY